MTLKELNIINFKKYRRGDPDFLLPVSIVSSEIMGLERPMSWMLFITFPCVKVILTCLICRISGTKNLFSLCRGKYERRGEELTVYCGVKRGQKKVFKKNQKAYDKLSEHIGLIPLVMISPEDFILIDGGSEERRKLVDGIISQCDRVYLHRLIRYNKALTQRNMLLKSAAGKFLDPEMLEVWNEQLAEHGEAIRQKRSRISEGIPVGISDLLRTVVSGAGRSMSGIQTFGKRG